LQKSSTAGEGFKTSRPPQSAIPAFAEMAADENGWIVGYDLILNSKRLLKIQKSFPLAFCS
jgi:hypothetical protein